MIAIAWAIIWIASVYYDGKGDKLSASTEFGVTVCFVMMVLLTCKELIK